MSDQTSLSAQVGKLNIKDDAVSLSVSQVDSITNTPLVRVFRNQALRDRGCSRRPSQPAEHQI